MRTKIFIVLASLFGAFCIYCTQSAAPGGAVRQAIGAEPPACCTMPAQSFVKLAEGDLTAGALTTPPIAIGGYTDLVLYVTTTRVHRSGCIGTCCPYISQPLFRLDASTPFGATGQSAGIQFAGEGAHLRVDGSDMMLTMQDPTASNFSGCASINYHYVIAGVQ